jgi:hypothetical protein
MKCRPEDMLLFDLDYGDLTRPPFRILRGRGWGQCTNQTEEYLIVYGAKYERERSIFDTSPYVLPPGATTPDAWDCEGSFCRPTECFNAGGGAGTGHWQLSSGISGSSGSRASVPTFTAALGTMAFSSRAKSTGPFPTFRIRT